MKPPTALTVEIETPAGVFYRWDGNAPNPDDRPRGLRFRTVRGEGFADGSVTLKRRTDVDWPDLGLLDTIRFIGHDGQIAYEGRLVATPRSVDEGGHEITVEAQGWMSHAADRTFTEVYVDRDLSRWQPMSRARRIALLSLSYAIRDFAVEPDTASGLQALTLDGSGRWPTNVDCEAWYDAGARITLGSASFDWTAENLTAGALTAASWTGLMSGAGGDDASGNVAGTDVLTGGTSGSRTETAVSGKRYAYFVFYYTAAASTNDSTRSFTISNLALHGSHGLTAVSGGYYASDVIVNIAQRFAPLLDTSGVTATDYPIQQCAFLDPTRPHDAFRTLNDFHLYELAVWEGKVLTFAPADLSTFKWQFRPGDFGQGSVLEGYDAEQLRNGIMVSYTNVKTGRTEYLSPEDYTQLTDTSESNPANVLGIQKWGEPYSIPVPVTTADALVIGQAALAELSRPRAPGSITARHHVLDAAENYQPAWKVRASDSCAIVNHPNDAARLINETSYEHDSGTLSVQVEQPSDYLSALFTRGENALSAANL